MALRGAVCCSANRQQIAEVERGRTLEAFRTEDSRRWGRRTLTGGGDRDPVYRRRRAARCPASTGRLACRRSSTSTGSSKPFRGRARRRQFEHVRHGTRTQFNLHTGHLFGECCSPRPLRGYTRPTRRARCPAITEERELVSWAANQFEAENWWPSGCPTGRPRGAGCLGSAHPCRKWRWAGACAPARACPLESRRL